MIASKTFRRTAAAAILLCAGHVGAAPTPAEIAQLGKSLTPIGAEMGANKDGSIPAWMGGLCKPPADYKPLNSKGGYPYADPFASDKPLYSVSAKNVAQYADKLNDGTKELIKRYPDSFRVDVYPTRRSACMPQWVYDNTLKNATKPKLEADGVGVSGAHAQVPFPIPKNGFEVMWNALLSYLSPHEQQTYSTYLLDAGGGVSLMSSAEVRHYRPYWDNKITELASDQPYWTFLQRDLAPANKAGSAFLSYSYMRPDVKNPTRWSYITGQRRVRVAPEFKYDTVSAASGGVLLFDEINGFDGKMDKYDFKLMGKKDMLIPYNNYKQDAPIEQIVGKHHLNPDLDRWELHRVWVVEARLKAGERHVQKTKRFYIDEDSWVISLYDGLDEQGKPHHGMQFSIYQEYEKPMPHAGWFTLYEFNKNAMSFFRPVKSGSVTVDPYPKSTFQPDAMAGGSVR